MLEKSPAQRKAQFYNARQNVMSQFATPTRTENVNICANQTNIKGYPGINEERRAAIHHLYKLFGSPQNQFNQAARQDSHYYN